MGHRLLAACAERVPQTVPQRRPIPSLLSPSGAYGPKHLPHLPGVWRYVLVAGVERGILVNHVLSVGRAITMEENAVTAKEERLKGRALCRSERVRLGTAGLPSSDPGGIVARINGLHQRTR